MPPEVNSSEVFGCDVCGPAVEGSRRSQELCLRDSFQPVWYLNQFSPQESEQLKKLGQVMKKEGLMSFQHLDVKGVTPLVSTTSHRDLPKGSHQSRKVEGQVGDIRQDLHVSPIKVHQRTSPCPVKQLLLQCVKMYTA